MEITKELILTAAPYCKEPDVVTEKLNQFLPKYGINTPLRILHYVSQVAHESNFNPIEENLGAYTAKNLVTVFPRYFPTYSLANAYVGKPAAIGSRVYANRYGNGNEASGDGYKYRGRGYIQLTFKDNYDYFGKRIGYNLVSNPDLCLQHGISTLVSCEYFVVKNILPYCDSNNSEMVTRLINGGLNGYDDRRRRFNNCFYYMRSLGQI